MNPVRALILVAVPCLVHVLACEQVAGIRDRKLDELGAAGAGDGDAGAPEPPSPLCEEYCNTVLEGCTDEYAVYSGKATCYGVCALLPEGDELEPVGNSVQCRLAQARNAVSSREPEVHCQEAGPGGNGVCGSNCEDYCYLLERACPDDFEAVSDCERKCAGLRDLDRFDVVLDHEGDSLQCRLVHVSAATVDPETHCYHAAFAPLDWCLDSPTATPDCEEYCNLVEVACTDDLAQYETHDQCVSVCQALDPGQIQDEAENTVGCRKYHSYAAMAVPDVHCYHAGPLGDGHCGHDDPDTNFKSNCESYCRILKAACSSDFDDAFADQEACQADCASQPMDFKAEADSEFTVASGAEENPDLHCRMLHLERAFKDDSECSAAMGGDPCN